MSTQDRNRQPAGITIGGQFATEPKQEAKVSLAAPGSCIICTDETAPGKDLCAECQDSEDRRNGKAPRQPSPAETPTLPAPERLAAMQPHEVDAELAETMRHLEAAYRDQGYKVSAGERASGLRYRGYGSRPYTREEIVAALRARVDDEDAPQWERSGARKALDDIDAADGVVAARLAEQDAYDAEWRRRGCWSRAFLVVGGDGHVHSSMSCSTCNRGNARTNFQFMTEFSGKDDDQIVEAAGWRACTVCYPSAPVGNKSSLPTSMWSDDEKAKAQAKAEREAKKAARDAAKIAKAPTPDGKELRVEWLARNAPGWERDAATGRSEYVRRDRNEHVVLATERAAVQWYVDEHLYFPVELDDKAPAFEAIERSLAAKHGKTVEEMRTELQAKIAAKRRREGV